MLDRSQEREAGARATLNPELEYFLSNSQWIDVPKLGMSAALTKLKEAVGQGGRAPAQEVAAGKDAGRSKRRIAIAAAVAVAAVLALAVHFWSNHSGARVSVVAAITDKSTAVLPFVDMSEKKDQEYFSDGKALLKKMNCLVTDDPANQGYMRRSASNWLMFRLARPPMSHWQRKPARLPSTAWPFSAVVPMASKITRIDPVSRGLKRCRAGWAAARHCYNGLIGVR